MHSTMTAILLLCSGCCGTKSSNNNEFHHTVMKSCSRHVKAGLCGISASVTVYGLPTVPPTPATPVMLRQCPQKLRRYTHTLLIMAYESSGRP